MERLAEYMAEYQKQVSRGAIQAAYQGLMAYLSSLRTYFSKKYPQHTVSGSLYYGLMDMSYFSITPLSIQKRGLKIALIYVHDPGKFEAWLVGKNKQQQKIFWDWFRRQNWTRYRIVPSLKGVDAILEHDLVNNPDFSNLDGLTHLIEKGVLAFIADIEQYLSDHYN